MNGNKAFKCVACMINNLVPLNSFVKYTTITIIT